jgi:glucokinase
MTDPKKRIQDRLTCNSWGILGNQGYVLGVDLGGYGLRIALVDLQHHTYTSSKKDILWEDPQTTLNQAMMSIRELLDESNVSSNRLVRIGVGFGGPVDAQHGVVVHSPRMSGWQNFSIKDYFEQAFDTVTLVDNDANLIALAEATFGIAQGCQDIFYLHLSSGVGGGIVLDGRLYRGAYAMAGEVGHAIVVKNWESRGHLPTLEQLVSVKGLLDRAEQQGLSTKNLNDLFHGHAIGQLVVDEAVDILALRLTQIIALLDPQMIVLGGIVVRIGGDAFVQAISEKIQEYTASALAHPTNIVASVLGADSIAIGALAMALESLQE